jgi:HAD superfamily hydrolase (TIGR01509 family)
MIKAVVFDMDGLLVDSEPIWQKSRIDAFGADRLRWTQADQVAVMGGSTRGWALHMAERLNHEYTVEHVIERVLDEMVRNYRQTTPLMLGAREIIDLLRGRYPLGLASGSPYRLIDAVFDNVGWHGVFDEIISTDDLPRGKPAPDVYLEIARRLGVKPDEVAIFEDSENGIRAGAAAGVRVIAVPSYYERPSKDVLSQADLVIESLLDFSLDAFAGW